MSETQPQWFVRAHVAGTTIDLPPTIKSLALGHAVDVVANGIWNDELTRLYPPHAIVLVDLIEVKNE